MGFHLGLASAIPTNLPSDAVNINRWRSTTTVEEEILEEVLQVILELQAVAPKQSLFVALLFSMFEA